MSRSAVALLVLLLGCSGGGDDDDNPPVVDCPTHDGATFELGTGDDTFEPIVDGDHLPISPGSQGGCHFFLSVRTDGFAQRRFKVRYEVLFADSATTTGSRSSFTVRLRPTADEGICENVGLTAFLIEPWKFAGEDVIFQVDVEDDEGRVASDARTVVGDWPTALGDEACGPR